MTEQYDLQGNVPDSPRGVAGEQLQQAWISGERPYIMEGPTNQT